MPLRGNSPSVPVRKHFSGCKCGICPPHGGQIMRAADCENLSKSPQGVFRQSQQPSTGGLQLDGFESLPHNAEKTNHERGWHWGRDEGFDCPFPTGKRYSVFRPRKSSPPPEGCSYMGSNPFRITQKRPTTFVVGLFWQRMRDSNPRERSQSPVCYRYTNPL